MTTTPPSPVSEAEFFRERGFGFPIGFGARPALLVVDLTRGFTDAKRPLGADLTGQIRATNALLELAHQKDIPVIFTSVRYDDAQLRDAGVWALKQKGTASLAAAGDGHELDPRLAMGPQDALIYKKYASCFFGTDLISRLVTARADTLIIVGTSTSGCVRASAVDACQNGFRPMVVKEAVGDRSAAAHEQSLFDLQAKYADVVSLEATLAYLRGLEAQLALAA
ncbi:Maleamate amidohydrolase [compost metagenome]|uniref:Isochorismatase family protein n=1 Tax=Polaromonas aquatica TaxID=332657 RepID=A0ABW1TT61_9BURK